MVDSILFSHDRVQNGGRLLDSRFEWFPFDTWLFYQLFIDVYLIRYQKLLVILNENVNGDQCQCQSAVGQEMVMISSG